MTAHSAIDPVAPEKETLDSFKKSFSYGTRNDLLFKFLKNLSDEEVADFFKGLLEALGESIDDGQMERLYAHVYAFNRKGYAEAEGRYTRFSYGEGPFIPLGKPLSQARVGLLTTTGHFAAGDDPEPFGVKNMDQQEAVRRIQDFIKSPPTLSAIPVEISPEHLRVRHGGYDIRAVSADPNVALPLDRLQELESEGVIGKLAPLAYSFVGAAAQLPLIKNVAPQWAAILKEQQIDAMLLVPI